MHHQPGTIALIFLPNIRTITRTIWIIATGTQTFAVSIGNVAIPQAFARPLEFAFACLLAEIVDINLRQHPKHGQGELAPWSGEVKSFLNRCKGYFAVVQLIEG